MAQSTGLVLTAGGIALANETVFAANAGADFSKINWRIVPATAILALALAGLEQLSEPLAKGLAGLAVLAVLLIPVGTAPTPLENVAKFVDPKFKG